MKPNRAPDILIDVNAVKANAEKESIPFHEALEDVGKKAIEELKNKNRSPRGIKFFPEKVKNNR